MSHERPEFNPNCLRSPDAAFTCITDKHRDEILKDKDSIVLSISKNGAHPPDEHLTELHSALMKNTATLRQDPNRRFGVFFTKNEFDEHGNPYLTNNAIGIKLAEITNEALRYHMRCLISQLESDQISNLTFRTFIKPDPQASPTNQPIEQLETQPSTYSNQ
jgi:hypothetical protein